MVSGYLRDAWGQKCQDLSQIEYRAFSDGFNVNYIWEKICYRRQFCAVKAQKYLNLQRYGHAVIGRHHTGRQVFNQCPVVQIDMHIRQNAM